MRGVVGNQTAVGVDLERPAAGATGATRPARPTDSAGPAVLAILSLATKNACKAIAAASAATTAALPAAAAATAPAAGTATAGGQDGRGAPGIHPTFATATRGPDRTGWPIQAGIRPTVRPDLARIAGLAVSGGGEAQVGVKMCIRSTAATATGGSGAHAIQEEGCPPGTASPPPPGVAVTAELTPAPPEVPIVPP